MPLLIIYMQESITYIENQRNTFQIGQRFARLIVLGYLGKGYWHCQCDCGNKTKVIGSKLNSGDTKSCGCLKRTCSITHGFTANHGQKPEYRSYHAARQRCTNPKNKHYADYGGRGIEFRFNSFEEFLGEVGLKPTGSHSIERINRDGHYEKNNVRWATPIEQSINRRSNRFFIHQGKTQTLVQWATELNLNYQWVYRRIYRGMCFRHAIDSSVEKCFHFGHYGEKVELPKAA